MSDAHERFKQAALALDPDGMAACLADDVVFHSPAMHVPKHGIDETMVLLAAVSRVFEDFRYVDEVVDGDRAVLRFRARVGDKDVEGVVGLTFSDDGLATELTVMVRPFSGMVALLERMGEELAAAEQA